MSNDSHELEIARKVRNACIKAAKEGFHEAAMSGLCMDGAAETAVGAMQSLDLEKIIHRSSLDN